ncbi:MAG: fasciclin domain-containing protein [Ktedonobacteraceae bacterium]
MANIFETARAERLYNKLVKGIESVAGLVETLSGPGPFTIFVPTNAAFDRLSDDQQANLFADPEKLARVLKYHIVPGYYTANALLDRLFLKTLEGQRLRVWSDISEVPLGEREIDTRSDALSYVTSNTVTTAVRESIKINGGHVIRANVNADNGIMHVLDKVLIPPFTML